MESNAQEFVEKVAIVFEAMGIPRSAGRIVGWLLIADGPQTVEDLTLGLGLGRGSVSASARLLETAGMIQRVRVTRDRRLFYRISRDAWLNALQRSLASIRGLRDLAREGLRVVDGQSPAAHARLASMDLIYTTLLDEMSRVSEKVSISASDVYV